MVDPSPYLTPDGLKEFIDATPTKIESILEDVFAQMLVVAPSIESHERLNSAQQGLVVSILRQASIGYESSSGGNITTKQEMAGSFSSMEVQDTRSFRTGLLTRAQRDQLEALEDELTDSAPERAHLVEVDLLPTNWSRPLPDLWR